MDTDTPGSLPTTHPRPTQLLVFLLARMSTTTTVHASLTRPPVRRVLVHANIISSNANNAIYTI